MQTAVRRLCVTYYKHVIKPKWLLHQYRPNQSTPLISPPGLRSTTEKPTEADPSKCTCWTGYRFAPGSKLAARESLRTSGRSELYEHTSQSTVTSAVRRFRPILSAYMLGNRVSAALKRMGQI